MTTATATNKSFSFTIDQGMTSSAIMLAADEALAWLDSHTEAELAAFLSRRAVSSSIVRFC